MILLGEKIKVCSISYTDTCVNVNFLEDVKAYCAVNYTLNKSTIRKKEKSFKNKQTKTKWRGANVTLLIQLGVTLGDATLQISVDYHGEAVGATRADYVFR